MNTKNLSTSFVSLARLSRTGVLLVNVGTPNAPTKKSVRKYLKEFLSDKRIIDIFWLFRLLLLYLVILPTRSKSSAKLYQKIWTPEGSPLLVWSEKCKSKLAKQLGSDYCVEIGMGYGNPSVKHGIDSLLKQNVEHLIIVPLFPQYAASTTGSVIENSTKYLNTKWHIPTYSIVKPFFGNHYFIQAWKELIAAHIAKHTSEHIKPIGERISEHSQKISSSEVFILFSYHGLPVRHLKRSAHEMSHSVCQYGRLDSAIKSRNDTQCCDSYCRDNFFCYRAQCFETTRLIANACNLEPHQFETSFQSRFGRNEWITPNTQTILCELLKKGVHKLSVVCPGFVADCLETLEEIEIRLREEWMELGGTDLVLIKSLNDNHTWISCLESLVKENDCNGTQKTQKIQ